MEQLWWNGIILMMAGLSIFILALILVRHILGRFVETSCNVYPVIFVKNQESRIEGIVRNYTWYRIRKKLMTQNPLIIVDLGSNDQTIRMLELLEKNHTELTVFTVEEFIKKLNEML